MKMFMTRPSLTLEGLHSLVRRFLVEDGAQDLVEYALLAAFIATAGMLALQAIGPAVATTYNRWMDSDTGVPSLWAPPEPSSGGS
jgi:Flp pilus assembly pilin Flp